MAKEIEVEKPIEFAKEIVRRAGTPAAERYKEALLRWLQKYSKRSRRHFIQIIDDIVHIANGIGGLAWISGKLLFVPSGISPEACGSVRQIEKERSAAMARVFSLPTKALLDPPEKKITLKRP